MALKEFAGGAPTTRLSGTLASGTTTTFSVITGGGTGYPTGATAPFVVVIDPGTALEEKILVTTRSADAFNGLTRGYDGTSAQNHSAQAVVQHVIDAATMTETNAHVNTVSRDDHTQYMKADGTRHDLVARHAIAVLPTGTTGTTVALGNHNHLIEQPHTWAVGADVKVPSGDTDYIPGFFVSKPATQTVKLTRCRAKINSGTSVTCKIQINGVDATGFTGISVTTTAATTDPADVTLADGDYVTLVVTAVSGSPKNMSFSAMLSYQGV